MDLVARLAATRLFAGVAPRALGAIAAATREVRLDDKEHLWWKGQPASFAAVVVRGLVQVVQLGPSGDANILALFGPREALGLSAALDGATYPADALAAAKDTVVLEIAAGALIDAAARDLEVSQALSRGLRQHTNALRTKIDVLSAGRVQAKLALLLCDLWERYGDEDEHGGVLPLALSRGTIASLVSARVETVIRQMTEWQREGVVTRAEAGFRLDIARLRAFAQAG